MALKAYGIWPDEGGLFDQDWLLLMDIFTWWNLQDALRPEKVETASEEFEKARRLFDGDFKSH